MSDLRVDFNVVSLGAVLDHFAKGYRLRGREVVSYETYVDQTKGVVVFKLFTQEVAPAKTRNKK